MIEAYKNCLKLDPTHPSCKAVYDNLVEEYLREKCEHRFILNQIEFYIGSESKTGDLPVTVPFQGRTYYRAMHPLSSTGEIDYMALVKGEFGDEGLMFVFTEAGKDRIVEITRNNLGRSLLVMIENHVVGSAQTSRNLSPTAVSLTYWFKLQRVSSLDVSETVC